MNSQILNEGYGDGGHSIKKLIHPHNYSYAIYSHLLDKAIEIALVLFKVRLELSYKWMRNWKWDEVSCSIK